MGQQLDRYKEQRAKVRAETDAKSDPMDGHHCKRCGTVGHTWASCPHNPRRRFSKDHVTEVLGRHIKAADDGYKFDPRLGYDQVERAALRKEGAIGRPEQLAAAHRAYGEWDALRLLAEELGLEID